MNKQIFSIMEHVKYVFTTFWGFLLGLFSAFWSFIKPEIYPFSIVFLAVLLDLFWGIAVAKKQGKFILSEAIRETFKKLSIYACMLLLVYSIEKSIHEDWSIATRVMCAMAAACELWSVSAMMLIVKPDMPFLKLFRRQLKGEIEKKLGTNVDDILKEKEL